MIDLDVSVDSLSARQQDSTYLPAIYMKTRYSEMVNTVRNDPTKIESYIEVFDWIFDSQKEKLIIDGGNIYFASDDYKELANFGAVVLGVENINEINGVQYNVELLIYSQFEKPKIVTLNSLELNSKMWIEKLGVAYRYVKVKTIQKIIKMMSEFAPKTDIYNYSGWATDKPDTYIIDGQELHGDDLHEETDQKAACEHTIKMLDVAERRLTIPLLAIALLSLVQSRLILLDEFFRGVLCMVGQSQSFKTTLATLFFDFIKGCQANINFDSTLASIIRTLGNTRDSVCLIDDCKPPSTRAMKNSLITILETVIRMSSDNSNGRQRAGSKNSIVSSRSHGIAVMTAEDILVAIYSTLARFLVLEMNRQTVNKENLTYFQSNHSIYREFIKNYIRYISQGVDKYCSNLKERFLNERFNLRNKLSSANILIDPRTNDMISWLNISYDEFLKYALSVNAIDPNQLEDYKIESEKIFLDLMEAQAERINELDDIRRFFKGLRDLLDTKDAKIEQLQARNRGFDAADSKSAIGFKQNGNIYLKNNFAFKQVVDYYRKFGKEFTISESTLRRMLNDNGYLIPKTAKSLIHRKNVNRENYQCIAFTEATFYKLLQGGNENDGETESDISDRRVLCADANDFFGRGD